MNRDPNAFLFLSANTPWVYALSESLANDAAVHSVRFYDWQTYWRRQPSWPDVPPGIDLRQTMKALPPGYAGWAEPLVRSYICSLLNRWQGDLQKRTGARPWVVAPYFYLAPWVTQAVPSDRLVYYNLDEYTLYRPERADTIRAQEDDLVTHAAHTVCLSQYQVNTLQQRHPERAGRIHHFPLGVDERYINPSPDQTPKPNTVGYVGNLSDRVDWEFVYRVAQSMPGVTFLFAGGAHRDTPLSSWQQTRDAAFSLSNVKHLGRLPQEDVTDVYWSCAVNWIPYAVEHPFNKASCPTKVMDTIASGRPVVSTPVPECTLYPEWIRIVDTVSQATSALRTSLETADTSRAQDQVAYAETQTWDARAHEFIHLLSGTNAFT